MIYTREEIKQMDTQAAEQALAHTEKYYRIEVDLIKNIDVWPQLDDVINQLLWLEDRIHTLATQQAAEQRAMT
jgi:hypothetical protein